MEFAGELHYSYNGRKSKLRLEEDKSLRFGFRLHAQYSRSARRPLQKTRHGLEEKLQSRGPDGHDGQGAAYGRLSGRWRTMDRISAV